MRWATERARTPRPRPTCSWQIRNPATNEVIHDRHICMLCCSLSLSRHFLPLSPSAFTASIRVRSVCTPIIDFCRQSSPSLSRSPSPLPREETEGGEQRTDSVDGAAAPRCLQGHALFFSLSEFLHSWIGQS